MASSIERVGNVFYRVRDMDSAVVFYRDVLGLPLRFRDGDRWTAFDVNGVTFALERSASPYEPPGATVSFRVGDVDRVTANLRSAGVDVRLVDGAHERRGIIRDPDGNVLVVYSPL